MDFYFLSAFGSGEVVERQQFNSATFDRDQLARYADLINKGLFQVELGDVHLDFRPAGPKSANVEVLSESSFSDHVQAGVRYVYAVQALDTAGNVSASSERVEETAR